MDRAWFYSNMGALAQIGGVAGMLAIGVVVWLRRRKGRRLMSEARKKSEKKDNG